MAGPVLVDAGPLVSALLQRERHHAWARAQFESLRPPLFTCEAVLSEAFFLLSRTPGGAERLAALLDREVVAVRFEFDDERPATLRLLRKYADTPMSFADACLVRMSELYAGSRLMTLDQDFLAYRRSGRERIPLLSPW